MKINFTYTVFLYFLVITFSISEPVLALGTNGVIYPRQVNEDEKYNCKYPKMVSYEHFRSSREEKPKLQVMAARLKSQTEADIVFIEDNKFDDPITLQFNIKMWLGEGDERSHPPKSETNSQSVEKEAKIIKIATCIDLGRVYVTYKPGSGDHEEKNVELRFKLDSSDAKEIEIFELSLDVFTTEEYEDGTKSVLVERTATFEDTIMPGEQNIDEKNGITEKLSFQIAKQNNSRHLLSTKYRIRQYHRFLQGINHNEFQKILESDNFQEHF